MNINLINDLNLTASRQSELVETDGMANDNDHFQQLLQFSENQTEQNKQLLNTKLNGEDEAHEDNDNDVNMPFIAMYAFNSAPQQQIHCALLDVTQHSDIKIDQSSLMTANVNTDLLGDLSTDTATNEQATKLLSSIYGSENLINKTNSQIDVMSLADDKKEVKLGHTRKQVTNIKGEVNVNINQTKNKQNANDFVQKIDNFQAQLITNNHNQDTTGYHNKELLLTPNTNGQNSLLSPVNATVKPATINLATQVNSKQWQTSLTEQIVMFNRQNLKTAEIKLQPQELGSLHIKLEINDDKMSLHMMAAHHVVKGMLESALPFLKTSLEHQGITLEQANIGDFSMMNDSQQSAMHQSKKNSRSQREISLDTTDDNIEPILFENHSLSTRISILA
ncbi:MULTISPECIES: flagellar hook-length control protein FliK [unclassified Gilliamella]|uniref:flagellar hook-length control protein FliK n=1 Tax=unclassified Gilliamella TaxID=2685620 RepID=UPI00130604D3|nr:MULTISPECIES: flagellar hook-length control protein FliK [unclassified Gilliamella]MWP49030.1 hypothetical protein [Gilliamella sp. Lep-s35]MWP69995.1 hypothetical protein [Gilliamella sp. Lep-s5]MWP77220.1 hypothetical protein [Gilliamella sp. Lep-s21]